MTMVRGQDTSAQDNINNQRGKQNKNHNNFIMPTFLFLSSAVEAGRAEGRLDMGRRTERRRPASKCGGQTAAVVVVIATTTTTTANPGSTSSPATTSSTARSSTATTCSRVALTDQPHQIPIGRPVLLWRWHTSSSTCSSATHHALSLHRWSTITATSTTAAATTTVAILHYRAAAATLRDLPLQHRMVRHRREH
uniref:Uncharacterized protein n=1 Tax=Anopheles melas TaxID=34690 RepID=A0A182TS69_9DIPT